jgi:hypothetical protein
MGSAGKSWRAVSFVTIAALFVTVGGWSATGGTAPETTYTGCLDVAGKGKGKLAKIQAGADPIGGTCASGFLEVHFSDGDVTGVSAGTGLTDGGTIGDIELAIDPAFQLPQSCASDEVAKWDQVNGVWRCASDLDSGGSSYAAGTGLLLNGSTFSVDAPFRLPQGCGPQQIAKWDSASQKWACAADIDTNTTYTPGTGLALSGSQFSVDSPYRLPQSCSTNAVPRWSGSSWTCSTAAATSGSPTIGAISGQAAVIAPSGGYVFVGPTTTLTVTAGQRLTGSVTAILGSTTTGDFDYGLCYQLGAGAITNFAGGDWLTTRIDSVAQPYNASASVIPPSAGTYATGFCVRSSTITLDTNDYVNGWIMATG